LRRRRKPILVESRRVDAIDPNLAAGRHVKKAQQIKKRRFPRTGGAHDGDKLTLPDFEIDVFDERHRHLAW